jgi:hypothetical protein
MDMRYNWMWHGVHRDNSMYIGGKVVCCWHRQGCQSASLPVLAHSNVTHHIDNSSSH